MFYRIVKTCPFRFLRDYYGDTLDVMFPQFPNYFLLFPLVFPHVSSSVSTIQLGVSTVSPQCFPRSLFQISRVGVACFVRNNLSYNTKSFYPSEIKNIFIEMFLPHSKSLDVGSIYRPPSQGSFTEIITERFSQINANDTEIYILRNFNINLLSNQTYIFHQTNNQLTSHEVKIYFQCCFLYDLEQLITSPTRVTRSTSSLIAQY